MADNAASPKQPMNPLAVFQPQNTPTALPFPWSVASDLYRQSYDYWVDAVQRQILFMDVLKQRSNASKKHKEDADSIVLHFQYELVLDGRKLPQPVNYKLLKIIPPKGVDIDPKKRPFIIFDPRAGHEPGIGGMKPDSEVGSTLRAGHPCYFVSFTPNPVPGQTIEKVCDAESIFVAKVIEMHPLAEKPCLIGNCQAGWQIAMMAAIYPELPGVLILAGSPLSYWGGVKGKFPLRYKGGQVGGSWLVSMMSDLGNGKFDGASLVQNFEEMNPANTFWKKAYNLYSKVDTEAQRFLDFERWWSSPILLNREEIQFIVDELFVGNKLSKAKLGTSTGLRIDLRNIHVPIVVFCSLADDITPPQQALHWIHDIYRTDKEIVAAGQTIVYCLHESIGHLGIFVSGSVASKEHDKFIQNIDLLGSLPAGLYEARFIEKSDATAEASMATGDYILRFEPRKIADILSLGGNDVKDDLRFTSLSRLSHNLRGLYETYASPFVKAFVTESTAEFMRSMHPLRLRSTLYSDKNPFLTNIETLAKAVRANRRPVAPNNMFWTAQEALSDQMVATYDAYRNMRDHMVEQMFLTLYGSTFLQATLGLKTSRPNAKQYVQRDLDRERGIREKLQNMIHMASVGGIREAVVRAMMYAVRGGRGVDERGYKTALKLLNQQPFLQVTVPEYRNLLRTQTAFLAIDERGAMETMPMLLDRASDEEITLAGDVIRAVVTARGNPTAEADKRLRNLRKYFVPSHSSIYRRAHDVEVFSNFAQEQKAQDRQSSIVTWNDHYNVGIADIDHHNKRLMEVQNTLYKLATGSNQRAEVESALDKLLQIISVHYNYENNLLVYSSSPDIEQHQQEHAQMINEVLDIRMRYVATQHPKFVMEMAEFLRLWLYRHILEADRRFGLHVQTKR